MLRFDAFEALGVACAAFSEKSDGNLARDACDDDLRSFCDACGVATLDLALVRQVHSNRVVVADPPGETSSEGPVDLGEADALIGGAPGVVLGIRAADCVPIYLFDPASGAVGLIHAGRAGTLQGIVKQTVKEMELKYGTHPRAIHALVGPSAGPCCYEVSPELAKECESKGLTIAGRNVDLWESNARQLLEWGIPAAQTTVCGLCTICDGRFHSHRAESNAGRNLALLAL